MAASAAALTPNFINLRRFILVLFRLFSFLSRRFHRNVFWKSLHFIIRSQQQIRLVYQSRARQQADRLLIASTLQHFNASTPQRFNDSTFQRSLRGTIHRVFRKN
jgi:hypothetical protein